MKRVITYGTFDLLHYSHINLSHIGINVDSSFGDRKVNKNHPFSVVTLEVAA